MTNTRLISVSLFSLILLVAVFAIPAWGQTSATDWYFKGMALYNLNKYEESIQAYDQAIALNPRDAEAWNGKGVDLGLLGKYDEALRAFGRATDINSSYAEAWFNAGVIYDLQERYSEAIQAYNMATEINPSYQKAWVNKNQDIDIIASMTPSCACKNALPEA
jgi:tetratricopeptide (TPR) repeat protein